jgi:hypothetical protein
MFIGPPSPPPTPLCLSWPPRPPSICLYVLSLSAFVCVCSCVCWCTLVHVCVHACMSAMTLDTLTVLRVTCSKLDLRVQRQARRAPHEGDELPEATLEPQLPAVRGEAMVVGRVLEAVRPVSLVDCTTLR